jgi:hypothetical protein
MAVTHVLMQALFAVNFVKTACDFIKLRFSSQGQMMAFLELAGLVDG